MAKIIRNGVLYGSNQASDINYSNTSSGLTATAVQGAIDEINNSLKITDGASTANIKFGIDADGNYGYFKVGADSVTPFKSGTDFDAIAQEYVSTETYDKDAIILKDDKLYQCNTDGTTGSWDSDKWDEVLIPDISHNSNLSASLVFGKANYNASNKVTVNLGYKPKRVIVFTTSTSNDFIYDIQNTKTDVYSNTTNTLNWNGHGTYTELTSNGFYFQPTASPLRTNFTYVVEK